MDDEESYFTNGYGIFCRQEADQNNTLFADTTNTIAGIDNIDVTQKILNSTIMDYYVSKTSIAIEGGYPCYQKNFIEKFNIPILSPDEIKTIRSIHDKHELDDFLIRKYHLNIPAPNLCE